ncbi:hypothetical protein I302_105479 [Kwoniella bestiolae CBS 10118]|uniref:Uncharacterized protein n=1 Tax=Kwoniella bestiolae CBS 10118 TaxID=1296100 RepID=A0A1B9FT97_9TREE|nr:hypothetical protein I302_08761 [Kwoniella bestiolae CBS 10118]OCF21980.1 hypothetical protein I302_08761 [Kwoniella bestiolae CBS 10118]
MPHNESSATPKQKQKEIHRNLPTQAQVRGIPFILSTASPPPLSDQVVHHSLIAYRTVSSKQPWPFTYIVDYFRPSSYYFIGFKDEFEDEEGRLAKAGISRELLPIAWVDGYNGMRYHQGLLDHLTLLGQSNRTHAQDELLSSTTQGEFQIAVNRLRDVCRNWSMCFPTRNTPRMDIARNSIHAEIRRIRIIDLQQAGYLEEFTSLARASGYIAPPKCQILGLSNFDEVAHEDNQYDKERRES